jgi:hypothetical protein
MLVLLMGHVAAVDGTLLRLQGADDTAVQRLHGVRQTWGNEVEMDVQPLREFLDCVAPA